MKISSKGDYALRTLLTLAMRNGDTTPVRLPEIAEQNGIPVKFLEQIMIQLKSAGFVSSRRGRHGGYLLGKKPHEITLGEVIRLIDGSIAPIGCVSRRDYISCNLEPRCVLKKVLEDVRSRIDAVVDGVTFEDLCAMSRAQTSPPRPANLQSEEASSHPDPAPNPEFQENVISSTLKLG